MARPFHDEEDTEAELDRVNVDENGRFVEAEVVREPRGEKKRKAIQLERLGEALIKLKPGQLARVPMPDDLRAAVVEAQRIEAKGSHGGYRRQVQLIGKIMRTIDAVPVHAALEDLMTEGTLASPAIQQAERWRTRLIDEGDAALAALVAERPGVDRTALRQLARAAAAEKKLQATKPDTPPANQKKLFRLLRELFEPALSSEAVSADGPALDSGDDVDESPPHV